MAEFANEMQKMQYNSLVEFINKRNDLVSKINAATGDREALVESVANSSDESIAHLRNSIADLQERFDALVAEAVDALLAESTDNAEGLQNEVKEIDETVKPGLSFYKKLYGDDAAAELPKLDRLKGARSGSGSGQKRIRGYDVDVFVDGETTSFENFSQAAKAVGVDTAALQEGFFAKAGVEKLKDAPDEVEFSVSWVEEDDDGNEFENTATVTARRTGPSGPPTASADEDEEEDVDVPDEDDLSEL